MTSLDDKYSATSGTVMMTGVQALVRTTLDQRRLDRARGRDTAVLVSGYQGSPLGGVDREMAGARAFLDPEHVLFQQGLNEELAATTVAGTQLVGQLDNRRFEGVTGVWYGKNPGLDRAADAIRHANISGTAPLGGAVAWIGDDPTSKSSSVPSSGEQMCKSLLMPLLAPGSVAELLEFGLHAIAMSRYAGLWTGLKIVADVADSTAVVDLDGLLDRIPDLPVRAASTPVVLLPPTNLDGEFDLMTRRLALAQEYAAIAGLNRITFEPSSPKVAIVAAGLGYQSVLRALSDLGLTAADYERLGLRLVQLGMPWPLDEATLRGFASGVETVLVVEDKLPFVESLFKEALYRTPDAPVVVGKRTATGAPLLSARSGLTSDDVSTALRNVLPLDLPAPVRRRTQLTMLPSRTPAFCSGCPHSVSTRAEPDKLVGVGIGCHVMVALDTQPTRGDLVGMTQMGGEGAQWLGLAPFTDDQHFIQNLGDGTFFHSGSLAVRAAVAAGVNLTYKLLVNDAVAMTGGQRPEGQLSVPELVRLLAVEGVKKIVLTTGDVKPWRKLKLDPIASVRSRDDIFEVQRELAEVPGVTVLMHVDRCATEERRLRKRGKIPAPPERIWVNERVCEGCGDCAAKSTCSSVLPVETPYGRKTHIHQSSCNQDFSCVQGDCPSFVRVVPGGKPRTEPLPSADVVLPEPVRRVGDDVLVRMPGIGGTGVVTVSQVLQMAAHLDGTYAAGLEQIGLAQKGGPVLSDVRFSPRPVVGQLRASRSSVDVLIAFDSLGAASEANLATLRPGRSIAVVNQGETPTSQMVQDATVAYPAWQDVATRLAESTGSTADLALDASALAQRFFADHLPANMILMGAAYQHGVLPVSGEAFESAVRLNGAAVEKNLAAFRLGRIAVAHPVLVSPERVEKPARPSMATYVEELTAYQDTAYAERFVQLVDEMSAGMDAETAASFAAGLFKLMAYKDEYEVARLHLDTAMRARLAQEFGEGAKVQFLLHPPMLRALGWKRKIAFGSWIVPVFRLLYALRRLRGSKLDLFGLAEVRRVERALPSEYVALVRAALAQDTDPETLRELCDLPDLVRGYEHIKLANVEQFRARAHELARRVPQPLAS